MRSLFRIALLGVASLFVVIPNSGCSNSTRPELGTVQGTVTLDGKPLEGATVSFNPKAEGRSSHGRTNQEGHYELTYIRDIKGVKAGLNEVSIRTVGPGYSGEVVPDKYNNQSTLTEEVKAGKNTIDFDLRTE